MFSLVRILLYPFALIYGAVVWLRNRLYDSGVYASVEFSVPVISVGNLSVGGTGKTPHVEYLIDLLQYQYRLATMSRGYKRRTQGFLLADEQTNALRIGDEPMQYFMKYPGITVSVAEERLTGIPALLQKRPDIETVILDDAYQHRSVKPGLNILITDFSKPFYTDHILPLGTLRERRSAYHRADVIIVSKCPPGISKAVADEMTRAINPLAHQKVFFTTIEYSAPYNVFTQETASLAGKNIVLVCGIAKPQPLIEKLKETASDVHVLSYSDHHYFVTKDLEEIKAAHDNWQVENKVIVTTEKDAARLHLHADKLTQWGIDLVVLPIKVSFLFNNGNDFDDIVLGYVAQTTLENQTYYDEKA
ncbi:MAG: tetraacyldisaccharide 4'-kinase [Sphingobacteriales bacterium]|nr:MAG: tetraacyldisaccharide 4'-kinase [Sphingobacteriales bacterium]